MKRFAKITRLLLLLVLGAIAIGIGGIATVTIIRGNLLFIQKGIVPLGESPWHLSLHIVKGDFQANFVPRNLFVYDRFQAGSAGRHRFPACDLYWEDFGVPNVVVLRKYHLRISAYLVYAVAILFSIAPTIAITGMWQSRHRRRKGYCAKCGYNLAGNTTGICPECGTVIKGD